VVRGVDDDAPGVPDGSPSPLGAPTNEQPTLGTGSALAIGCVIVVVLIVLVALLARWSWGGW
jgi:hypothetical protein